MQKLKVWYNPETRWYEIYLPDGTEVPSLAEVRVKKIDDNFEEPTTAIFMAMVEVVNERPKTPE